MVGKYGDIIFETSDERITAFNNFTQTVSGRWSSHAVIGRKERAEFNGPGKRKISFSIVLNALYGVRPRNMLEKLENMVETGKADYLIIGGRPVGNNRFFITGISETWDVIYSRGELAQAKCSITMEEYV